MYNFTNCLSFGSSYVSTACILHSGRCCVFERQAHIVERESSTFGKSFGQMRTTKTIIHDRGATNTILPLPPLMLLLLLGRGCYLMSAPHVLYSVCVCVSSSWPCFVPSPLRCACKLRYMVTRVCASLNNFRFLLRIRI